MKEVGSHFIVELSCYRTVVLIKIWRSLFLEWSPTRCPYNKMTPALDPKQGKLGQTERNQGRNTSTSAPVMENFVSSIVSTRRGFL